MLRESTLGSNFQTATPSMYEAVAAEYYDVEAHPTCSNFREGSIRLVTDLLEVANIAGGRWCDAGSGRSVLVEVLANHRPRWVPRILLLVDSSATMLGHTRTRGNPLEQFLVADVHSLPIDEASLDFVVASLGDPYNDEAYWSELARVVQLGGQVIFTTPSFGWATKYRRAEGSSPDAARFVLRTGEVVDLPSFILALETQVTMMRAAGFSLRAAMQVNAEEITGQLSAKLPSEGPIVWGYLVERSG